MSKINTLITKQIVELLGAQVRVDFVEESKSPPIFGRLYIWDPESHSIVIGTEFDSEKGCIDPGKILLIPGSSIQNVQFLQHSPVEKISTTTPIIESDQQQEQSSSSSAAPSQDTAHGCPPTGNEVAIENNNNKEFCDHLDSIFCRPIETPSNANEMEISEGEGRMEVAVGGKQPGTKRRTPIEAMEIFDNIVLSRRQRLLDALRKTGICYRELPYLRYLTGKITSVTADEHNSGQQPGRQKSKINVILINNNVKIYPPYKKGNISGPNPAVTKLTRALKDEGVFDEK